MGDKIPSPLTAGGVLSTYSPRGAAACIAVGRDA